MLELNKLVKDSEKTLHLSELLKHLTANQLSAEEEDSALAFIARKAEISGRLFANYDASTGAKATNTLCSVDETILAVNLIAKHLAHQRDKTPLAQAFKWLNASYKLLDNAAKAIGHNQAALQKAQRKLNNALEDISAQDGTAVTPSVPPFAPHHDSHEPLKTAPLTVLFFEGPIARAYIETLRSIGYKPKRILNLVSTVDLATRKPILSFLPNVAKRPYCKLLHRSRAHHWSDVIRKKHPELFTAMKNAVVAELGVSNESYQNAYQPTPLREYCDDVRDVFVSGLTDARLLDTIQAEEGPLLFTGGGIVPKVLLELPKVSFLHIHPGYLPALRGADCTLWSWLLKNQPSASLFCLAPGIDDGDVITTRYLPAVEIPALPDNIDLKTKYRAIYAYYDPWIRASIIKTGAELTNVFQQLETIQQDHDESMTFHFMHPKLQQMAFNKIFQ